MTTTTKMAAVGILIAFAESSYGKTSCTHDHQSLRCVLYVKNYDGDTITVRIPGVHPIIGSDVSVRLRGIDTPEIRTQNRCEKNLAVKVRDYVRARLSDAKRIDLTEIERGKYFRIVANIRFDGKSLTSDLLDKGYGYPYQGGKKQKPDWCKSIKLTH